MYKSSTVKRLRVLLQKGSLDECGRFSADEMIQALLCLLIREKVLKGFELPPATKDV